jgi:predicted anti-sigma-YlaC factor YlaD
MDLKCLTTQKKLSAYLDRQLAEDKCREIEQHLRQCPLCFKEKEMLERSWELLNNIKSESLSPSFESEVWQKIYVYEQEKNKSFLGKILNLTPATAAAMILLGIISGWYLGNELIYKKAILNNETNNSVAQQDTLFYLESFDDLPVDSVGVVLLNGSKKG